MNSNGRAKGEGGIERSQRNMLYDK
jgi:hypothetical protein